MTGKEDFDRITKELNRVPSVSELESMGRIHLIKFLIESERQKISLEKMRDFYNRFLEITNKHTELIPLLTASVAEIKEYTQFDAVGIRILNNDGTIPYHVHDGFPVSFYDSENLLSITADQCMCIYVVTKDVDSSYPFITDYGSFYTDTTTQLLRDNPPDTPTRNVCNAFGYESVAVVPIQLGDTNLGVIHIADKRVGMVPEELVRMIEKVAMQLGAAIQRIRSADDLKQSEEKYRRLSENLETEVMTRTEKLVQSEKLASIGRLAAGVAHEINNPIMGILNYTQIVKNELRKWVKECDHEGCSHWKTLDLNKKPFSFLDGVIRESTRIAEIVDSLLGITRQDDSLVETDITSVIDSTISLFLAEFQRSRIRIFVYSPKEIPPILISPYRVQQVFVNLIQNAVDAVNTRFVANGGEKAVTVEITVDMSTVTVTISDNGNGILPDHKSRIFEPFFSTKPKGVGLGLSVSYKIIQDHRGTLEIHSQLGVGTDAIVSFPLIKKYIGS